jgi:hypothetical protein
MNLLQLKRYRESVMTNGDDDILDLHISLIFVEEPFNPWKNVLEE